MGGRLAWPALVVGVLLSVAGLAVVVVLGPDSRFTTGPHEVDTDAAAVVTAPGVVSYRGLQVDVLVEVPVNKPVFVGLGNTVDVQDYVSRTQRLEVTSFRVPWTVRTREVEGGPALPGAPTALDWWIAESAGLGGASISASLPDESVSVAVLAVGASDLSGLTVTFAYGVKGGFGLGLGAVLVGAGLVWVGVLLRRDTALAPARVAAPGASGGEEEVEEVEEVVYVFVDERGVEHEISEDEAERLQARLDLAEQAGRDDVPTAEAAGPDSSTVDRPVETASGEQTPPAPAPAPATPMADPPAPTPVQDVVYVFVDEDGVEHEVSADELADYEVVDEEDER
ncbi:hypothetical protein [Aeromicrobium sp. Leaf272]|uniref:hypothetical protein n=1 Tax=Aeromicrobium sp. Leaf272 TaxID=1736317 RepID=UPI0006FA60A4|nr:hypothetical protein [Aeromicrobium sp. Leaf272]KQP25473.1 hypothetical protein ASF38_13445 [Aeromicrobium sp. Leaf272]